MTSLLFIIPTMDAYATKLAEAFAQKVIKLYYQRAVSDFITNRDYEGDITDKASRLNILTFGAIAHQNYTGANLTPDDLEESNGLLATDQQKAYYFKIKSLDQFKSFIKKPQSTILDQIANDKKKVIDTYVLGLYGDTAAGHWIGTNYTTGTVEIDADGNVTGSSTVFTAAMVGKPFKAAGHSKWYRVRSRSSNTAIVIEQDLDDAADNDYDGGVIAAGATYVIQANTAVQVTKSTIYNYLLQMKTKLDQAEIPETDRWAAMPAELCNLFLEAPELIPAVPMAYEKVIQNGRIGRIAGFDMFSTERVAGNTTDGWHCLAGHKSAITFATGYTETGIEDLIGNFGKAYKGLVVYGGKIVDERRKALVHAYLKL